MIRNFLRSFYLYRILLILIIIAKAINTNNITGFEWNNAVCFS